MYWISDIKPAGYIPEFDMWNIEEQGKIIEHIQSNPFLSGDVDKICSITIWLIDELVNRGWESHFYWKFRPLASWVKLAEYFYQKFLNPQMLVGIDNFYESQKIAWEKWNVLVLQNHRSAMDGVITGCLLRHLLWDKMSDVGFIASQVFEYCRPFSILTSGWTKYPVFQDKHIQTKSPEVQWKMRKLNSGVYRALRRDLKQGGKTIFIYPEIDRGVWEIGAINPSISKVIELMRNATQGNLVVTGSYISSSEDILENADHSGAKNPFDRCFSFIKRSDDVRVKFWKPSLLKSKTLAEEEIKNIILSVEK